MKVLFDGLIRFFLFFLSVTVLCYILIKNNLMFYLDGYISIHFLPLVLGIIAFLLFFKIINNKERN